MSNINWRSHMQPLSKDGIEEARQKQRRKKFAGFALPSTAHEWSDDQSFAYKGMRDELNIDPLRAEQYVNAHTDSKKPSGRANLFYPATEPSELEHQLRQKLSARRQSRNVGSNAGAAVQYVSQSGHTMMDGERAKPQNAPQGSRQLIDEVTRLGRQAHTREMMDNIAKKAGKAVGNSVANGTHNIGTTDNKKRKMTVTVDGNAFTFDTVYTAEDLMGEYPRGKAMMQFRPSDNGMALVKGDDGKSFYVDNASDTYKALQKARNIQRAEVIAETSAALSFLFPRTIPVAGITGAVASGYIALNEPNPKNFMSAFLSRYGKIPFKRMGWSETAAQRGSSAGQIIHNRLEYGDD